MKIFKLFLIAFLLSSPAFAQDSENNKGESFNDRLFSGGNIGLNFGTYTNIEVAPILGYRFTDYLAAGIGGKYQFYKDKTYVPALKTELFGGSVFARVYFFKSVFIHTELEVLSLETEFWDYYHQLYQSKRFAIASTLVGVGYRQTIGEGAYTNIMLLYNLNEGLISPYPSNPIFKVGLEIDL